ncbi:MAG: Lrp/AsnC family transcriptional regulator [Planctomycetes bacterium]|nr:Lrp/AsnC family transcriptional regulator [Planctomycetota bacterium]
MDDIQKQILNVIQGRFPLERRPFLFLAKQFGAEEGEVIEQVRCLKEEGIIRYIGPVFDAGHLGYVSTLVAAEVPEEKIAGFVAEVNAMPGVSHNYGRAHDYNIWFTMTMESKEAIDDTIERLKLTFGIEAIYSLPALKMYKIRVNFDFKPTGGSTVGGGEEAEQAAGNANSKDVATVAGSIGEEQKELIRELQKDLPLMVEPFDQIAAAVDSDVEKVLDQVKQWKSAGLIRRFGARVRHAKAGFTANGMVVFEIEPERMDEVGEVLAGYKEVSHCYHRPAAPGWPYNMFAMTHSRSQEELKRIADRMVEQVKPIKNGILLSIKEYKKSSVKFFQE